MHLIKEQSHKRILFYKTREDFGKLSTLIEKDTVFTDKWKIAELFNEHFVHIALNGVGEIKEG